ncbi:hypothetical protein IPN35_04885 [Candidatus Peregrinibacteria bacterium]|nr:MAG: hypothetical protein IPN35_04885 [Candidatus Peregrinibacteria bacterium]
MMRIVKEYSAPSDTPEQKLERIAELLERIEKHLAPPPLWKRILFFVFPHILTFIILFLILLVTWKMWSALEFVSENISAIQIFLGNIKEGLEGKINSLQFWN